MIKSKKILLFALIVSLVKKNDKLVYNDSNISLTERNKTKLHKEKGLSRCLGNKSLASQNCNRKKSKMGRTLPVGFWNYNDLRKLSLFKAKFEILWGNRCEFRHITLWMSYDWQRCKRGYGGWWNWSEGVFAHWNFGKCR